MNDLYSSKYTYEQLEKRPQEEVRSNLYEDILILKQILRDKKVNAGVWVNAEDKLPQKSGGSVFGSEWVLGVNMDGFVEVNIVRYVYVKEPFWKLIGDEKTSITHWMPLPDPPRIKK